MNIHLQKDKQEQFIGKIKRARLYRKTVIIFSVLLNIFLLARMTNTKVEKIVEREYYFNHLLIDKVYDLNNYESYADPSSTLGLRFKKLYDNYLKDKTKPKRTFYNSQQELDAYWQRACINNIRKIHNLLARIEDIERSLSIISDGRSDDLKYFELLAERSQHKEKLSEMSNFYAKFITNYTYDTIVKTID